eukprot:1188813-Prorocentrum_minimum.AAC.7
MLVEHLGNFNEHARVPLGAKGDFQLGIKKCSAECQEHVGLSPVMVVYQGRGGYCFAKTTYERGTTQSTHIYVREHVANRPTEMYVLSVQLTTSR